MRHSLATDLVAKGASLDEIGDMLRHRGRRNTMIYAKMDIEGLRSIAKTWPTLRRCTMTALTKELDRYLSIRRKLGYDLSTSERVHAPVRRLC